MKAPGPVVDHLADVRRPDQAVDPQDPFSVAERDA
jgi:hypothetical protein